MLGIATETLLTIGTILLVSFVQVILTIKGKTDDAIKLEAKKTKLIEKLTKKRDKNAETALKIDKQIKEIKDNETRNT